MDGNRNVTAKKKMFSWTEILHFIFLKAIINLGVEEAVPSKILEVMMNDVMTSKILKAMNEQELTRTNVSSHWQKFREFLLKTKTIRRRNKFARWQVKSYICELHMYIKCQLDAASNSSRRASSNGRHLDVPLSFEQDESMFCLQNNLHSSANLGGSTTIQDCTSHTDSYCLGSISNDNNNNNNVSAGFRNINVVAGNSYDQTMASLVENNVVAATPIVCPQDGPHTTAHTQHFHSYNSLLMNYNYGNVECEQWYVDHPPWFGQPSLQEQGIGETLGARQLETSQHYFSESAGDSNSALLDASGTPQGIFGDIYGLFADGELMPRLDDIRAIQDLEEF